MPISVSLYMYTHKYMYLKLVGAVDATGFDQTLQLIIFSHGVGELSLYSSCIYIIACKKEELVEEKWF